MFPVGDGRLVRLTDTNAATFGLTGYLSRDVPLAEWAGLEAPSRFSLAFAQLFGDPYARAGLFASVDIRPWNWVFKRPAEA